MDPFFEVRTPERNYGPAKLASGTFVTPLARRLAGERGIDLSRLGGSGPHGRIVARDVEAAIASGAGRACRRLQWRRGASPAQVKALYQGVDYEEVPLDGMRKTIAARLTEAKQTIPHFYLTMDVELDALLKLREEANAGAPKKGRRSRPTSSRSTTSSSRRWRSPCSACRRRTRCGPGDRILRFKHSDIGVAVAIDGGLITPVIRNAEQKSLSAISNEMKELAARARATRSSSPPNIRAARRRSPTSACTACASSRRSSIRRTPPSWRSARRSAGRSRRADGGVRFVSQMTVTLSCDHRVVDGALGAELLRRVQAVARSPVRMLV